MDPPAHRGTPVCVRRASSRNLRPTTVCFSTLVNSGIASDHVFNFNVVDPHIDLSIHRLYRARSLSPATIDACSSVLRTPAAAKVLKCRAQRAFFLSPLPPPSKYQYISPDPSLCQLLHTCMVSHLLRSTYATAIGHPSPVIGSSVNEMVGKHGVVMYSKSYCPFCTKAKKALDTIGAKYEVSLVSCRVRLSEPSVSPV